ncbi:DUF456 domain-containing protein [Thermaerobacter subterraneus]|uniref:DUF456 domain-containing protein n=1 Tax=Thermaerobacter subterraneus DSM 13965 TaxID=867903 RepID=K6PYV1_9FIRM|nr:DUF456 domain-containing protein [Thermaerobacter subterraneus]EKP93923.1 hypothetical protein ThesuDRAFT_00168 [Thermaerobacter subterraneus DSM 13965]
MPILPGMAAEAGGGPWWLALLASIGIAAGLVGTVLPALPGIPLVFLSIAGYAVATGFREISGTALLVMLAATVAGMALEYGLGPAAARRRGASRAAFWGAIAGGLAGTFILGPLGILLGPLAGAVVGELASGRTWQQALSTGWTTAVGLVAGLALELLIGLAMAVYFWIRVLA